MADARALKPPAASTALLKGVLVLTALSLDGARPEHTHIVFNMQHLSCSLGAHAACNLAGMTLGERIRTARLAAGFTSQQKLADACGWDSASRIGNYEQDTREPSLADLRTIADAVRASGYGYAWLVLGDDASGVQAGSQPARLSAATMVNTTQALRTFLGRRGIEYDPIDHAALFVAAYHEADKLAAQPSSEDLMSFASVVADLVQQYVGGGR